MVSVQNRMNCLALKKNIIIVELNIFLKKISYVRNILNSRFSEKIYCEIIHCFAKTFDQVALDPQIFSSFISSPFLWTVAVCVDPLSHFSFTVDYYKTRFRCKRLKVH